MLGTANRPCVAQQGKAPRKRGFFVVPGPRAWNTSLSLESRFDLAYNAAHALCLSALRQHGFRPAQRYIVFQVLPHRPGLGPEVWRVLDKCHQQRNVAEYEGELDVSERLVLDLIIACDQVRRAAGLDD